MKKIEKNKKNILISLLLITPLLTNTIYAADANSKDGIGTILDRALVWVSFISVILMGLVFIGFLYGLFKMVTAKSDDKVKEAKAMIGWNLLALVAMAGVWSIVNVILGTFNVNNDNGTNLKVTPKVPIDQKYLN